MGMRVANLEWPLCELEAASDAERWALYRQIYLAEYVGAEVRDWAGRLVVFHAPSFEHAFSEASNYRLSAGVHDVPYSDERLKRIYWIKLALAAEGINFEVIAQTRKDSRGRDKKRRTLIVLDNRYVVVLEPDPVPDDKTRMVFITAFPAQQAYLDRMRRGAQVVERRSHK
jgi:hypothetical protein